MLMYMHVCFQSITSIKNHKLLERCLNFLAAERDGSVVFDSGSHTVCLVANLIHLAHIFQSSSLQEIDKLQFAVSILIFYSSKSI